MTHPQHPRKPLKRYHRGEQAAKWAKVEASWPDLGIKTAHDGAPEPRPQGTSGWKRPAKGWQQ